MPDLSQLAAGFNGSRHVTFSCLKCQSGATRITELEVHLCTAEEKLKSLTAGLDHRLQKIEKLNKFSNGNSGIGKLYESVGTVEHILDTSKQNHVTLKETENDEERIEAEIEPKAPHWTIVVRGKGRGRHSSQLDQGSCELNASERNLAVSNETGNDEGRIEAEKGHPKRATVVGGGRGRPNSQLEAAISQALNKLSENKESLNDGSIGPAERALNDFKRKLATLSETENDEQESIEAEIGPKETQCTVARGEGRTISSFRFLSSQLDQAHPQALIKRKEKEKCGRRLVIAEQDEPISNDGNPMTETEIVESHDIGGIRVTGLRQIKPKNVHRLECKRAAPAGAVPRKTNEAPSGPNKQKKRLDISENNQLLKKIEDWNGVCFQTSCPLEERMSESVLISQCGVLNGPLHRKDTLENAVEIVQYRVGKQVILILILSPKVEAMGLVLPGIFSNMFCDPLQ